MSEDLMRYDLMAQEALRGVVRASLERIAQSGLPGEHHFYIAFDTHAPGVRMSDRLREQYEDEMTVVLQHQFWNLEIGRERFSVELNFNNVPEKLVVPFASIKGFFDPSVQFGLQFETPRQDVVADTPNTDLPAEVTEIPALPLSKSEQVEKSAANEDNDTRQETVADVVELDAFRKK